MKMTKFISYAKLQVRYAVIHKGDTATADNRNGSIRRNQDEYAARYCQTGKVIANNGTVAAVCKRYAIDVGYC